MGENRFLSFFVALISISLIAQTKSLPRSTPEQEGVSSESIVNLLDAFEKKIEFVHSYMIVKNGKVISEGWWDPMVNIPHELWSLSKVSLPQQLDLRLRKVLYNT